MKKILFIIGSLFLWAGAFAQTEEVLDIKVASGYILAADLRNSGNLDVLIGGTATPSSFDAALYINNGGTLTKVLNTTEYKGLQTILNAGHYPFYRVADLNGDGNLDIIYSGRENISNNAIKSSGIMLGDGKGNFTATTDYPILSGFRSAEVVDFNNDGLMDILYMNEKGGSVIYFQQKNGTYTSYPISTTLFAPDFAISTFPVDINNDGFIDVAILSGWDNVYGGRGCILLKNKGDGTFNVERLSGVTGKGFGSVAFADVDGDGYLDMTINGDGDAKSGENNHTIFRLYKNNNGSFTEKYKYTPVRYRHIWGGARFLDWDNDNKIDLLFGGYDAASTGIFRLAIGTDPANFAFNTTTPSGMTGLGDTFIEVADLNNDSKPDLIYSGKIRNQDASATNCHVAILKNTTTNQAPTIAVPTLNTAIIDGRKAKFSWNKPATTRQYTYNIAIRNKDTGKWIYSPLSDEVTGKRKVTGYGNIFLNTSLTLNGLGDGNYEWSVQIVDINGQGGAFAPFQNFTIVRPQLEYLDANVSIGYTLVGDLRNSGNMDIVFTGTNKSSGSELGDGVLYVNNAGVLEKTAVSNFEGLDKIVNVGRMATFKTADLNGDGNLDILYTGRGNGNDNVKASGIVLGNGTGKFSTTTNYPLMVGFRSVEVADFNNDGLMDIFYIKEGSKNAEIHYQNVDGTFTKHNASFSNVNLDSNITTYVIDFNNDGYKDLVILAGWDNTNGTRGCLFYKNNKDESFSTVSMPNVKRKGFGSAAFADIDGDGWVDMILNGDGGADGESANDIVRLYRNNNGNFEPKNQFSPFRFTALNGSVRFVDWDNDGKLDILVAGYDTGNKGRSKIYKCTSATDFTYVDAGITDLPAIGSTFFEVVDLDNDGRSDITFEGMYNRYSFDNKVGLYWNAGVKDVIPSVPENQTMTKDGKKTTFSWDASKESTTNAGITYNLAIKDMASGKWLYSPLAYLESGKRKITGVGNTGNQTSMTLELPDGSYQWTVQAIGANGIGGKFGEMKAFSIYPSELTVFDPTIGFGNAVAADFRGTGFFDILLSGRKTNNYNEGGFYVNNQGIPEKAFAEDYRNMETLVNAGGFACYKIADLDGDGNFDIIYSGRKDNSNDLVSYGILMGIGDGGFRQASKYPVMSGGFRSAEVADFNNDGLMDIFYVRENKGLAVIYYQQKNGSFVAHTKSFENINVDLNISTFTVDFNNDGYLDLVILAGWDYANNIRGCHFFKNNGDESFSKVTMPDVIRKGYGSVAFADIDGDGWMDMLLCGDGGTDGEGSNYVYRLYKNEAGNFVPKNEFKFLRQRSLYGGARFVDWDNDGILDILISGFDEQDGNAGKIRLYKGTDAVNFQFVEEPLANIRGVGESFIDIADFDNNGVPDMLFMGREKLNTGNNISGIYWNLATTQINTPPTAPQNLKQTVEGTNIILEWGAAEDVETPNNLTYNLVIKNKDTGLFIYSPMASDDGTRMVTGYGNALLSKSKKLNMSNLTEAKYEWYVQAIDANGLGGPFSDKMEFDYESSLSDEETKSNVFQDGMRVRVDTGGTIESIVLTNLDGVAIYKGTHPDIDITPYPAGLYVLKVKVKGGKEERFKVVRR